MFSCAEGAIPSLLFLMNYKIEREENMPQDRPNPQKQDISKSTVSKIYTGDDARYNPTKGETALWTAVITQALMDAGSASAKPEAQHEKAKAIRWLLGNSEDFITVCQNAGKDPAYIREKAKKAIARGCVWRRGMQEQRAEKPAPLPSLQKKYHIPAAPPNQPVVTRKLHHMPSLVSRSINSAWPQAQPAATFITSRM